MSINSATQAIVAAVKVRYDSSDGNAMRAEGSTGFYYGRAPNSAAYPFVVVNVPASVTEPTVGQGTDSGQTYNDISLDVSVFDNRRSPDRALSIIGLWHTAFHFTDLTLASPYTQVMGYKTQDALTMEEPEQKGWHVVATYAYNIAE
jgi:hypothetical protein